MTCREDLARLLRDHELAPIIGGTATGSTWECQCGETGTTPGVRGYAHWLGLLHVAAVLPDVRRAVAEEIATAIQEERERYANGPQDGPQPFISVGLMYAQGIAREIGGDPA